LDKKVIVTDKFIPRKLSFQHDREAVLIDSAKALADPRLLGRPLMLLGEAGSGKSELLRQWGGSAVATARQVTYGWRPTQGRVFIDGLDEAAGLHDGDALDRLLGVLEAQQNTDFIIACRVADWRSASGKATIKHWTGVDPVEITIEPFGRSEIVQFLKQHNELSQAEAEAFVTYYEDRALSAWLGNPQTLTMLSEIARDGQRPETTGSLFRLYVEKTWIEHRRQDTMLANASQQQVLDALGAIFVALIIGGYEAVTRAPGASRTDSDLPLEECNLLPGIASLTNEQLSAFLGSRLVSRAGEDRFTYQHRRIGEYLGARWLSMEANTQSLRERVLTALQHGGVVPSNLRGLWGWLGDYPNFATEVIRTDPLAILDYGDADTLGPAAAKQLLASIERVEDEHQSFGWQVPRAASLLQPGLSVDIERVLSEPGNKRFWTQFILLGQMRNAEVVLRHKAKLQELMLNEATPYSIRFAAAEALADHGNLSNWSTLVRQLSEGIHDTLWLVRRAIHTPFPAMPG
jgi:hypothetical protein